MATRRFGPVKGAGTVVIEQSGESQIRASDMGVFGIVGPWEKGDISTVADPKFNLCPSAGTLARKMGGRRTGSVVPDVAQDYFSHSNGAGEIVGVRIADGTQKVAEATFYSRDWGTDYVAPEAQKQNSPQQKRPMLKVKAKNAGLWGGKRRVLAGEVTGAGDVTPTTLTTGITVALDEFAGATLTLVGVTFKTYKVLSNTTAGGFTVEAGSTMLADLGAGPTEFHYSIVLDPAVLDSGAHKAIGVRIRESQDDQANNFGMDVLVDGLVIKTYQNLSMDPTSKYYVTNVINNDTDNFEIEVVDLFAGSGYTLTPDVRPANYYGRLTGVTATTATFEPVSLVSVSDAGVKVTAINWPAGAAPVPHKLTFAWRATDPDPAIENTYSVVAEINGLPETKIQNLPAFAVGNGTQWQKSYAADNKYTVGIVVDHATEPANGAKIVLDVHPIDTFAAVGGEIIPNATNYLNRLRIRSATYETVTVESGDPSALGTGSAVATITGTGAETYDVTLNTDDKVKLAIDGREPVTVTLAQGAARTAAQVVADINTAFASQAITPASVSGLFVKLTSPGGLNGGGPGSSIAIQAVADDAYTLLGWTVGTTYGAAGSEAQLVFPAELGGGFDGAAPATQNYLDALAIGTSPFNKLEGLGKGVVQITCPDTTDTTIQKAGIAYGEAKNHVFHVLIPTGTTDESSVVTLLNSTIGRSDMALAYFPSYASVVDPDKSTILKEIPVTGMVVGRDSLYARAVSGYHRPAAGLDATLPRIVKLPTGDKTINEEILTPQGANIIKKKAGNFVIWGARTLSKTSEFQFKNHRLQLSHYEHSLFEEFDWIIFMLNDALTQRLALSSLRAYFKGEFSKGAIVGRTLEEAAILKIDEANNTGATIAAGDMNASISLSFAYFVERFVMTLSKAGIFEGTSA